MVLVQGNYWVSASQNDKQNSKVTTLKHTLLSGMIILAFPPSFKALLQRKVCIVSPGKIRNEDANYLTIIRLRLSEYCRIIPETKTRGLFDNIH